MTSVLSRRRVGRRLPVLVVAASLLLGPACGGSDTPTAAEDKETAARIVLTSADLPGYEREPEEADEDDSSESIDQCVNNNPLLTSEDKSRSVDGDDFTKDDGDVRVQSGAFVATKEAEARTAFSDLKSALESQCLKDGLKKAIEEDADPGLVVRDVSASPLSVPEVADEAVATRLTIPLEAGRERISAFVDMTFLRRGRVVAGLFTFQAGSPFPDDERNRLTTVLGGRLSGKVRNTPETGPRPTVAPTTSTVPPTTAAATSANFTRFRDPSGVSLEHPRTWTVEPSSGSDPLILFLDPARGVPFRRNVNVMLQTGPRPFTLDEYTQISLKQINDIDGATIGESRPTTLSGSPAYRLSYRADLGAGDLRFLGVWTIRNGKAWLVTYSADPARFNAGLPEIERLLTTIQLPA